MQYLLKYSVIMEIAQDNEVRSIEKVIKDLLKLKEQGDQCTSVNIYLPLWTKVIPEV